MKKIILMSLLCVSACVHGMYRRTADGPAHYHGHMQFEFISEVNLSFPELQISEIEPLRDKRIMPIEVTDSAFTKISTGPIDYNYFFKLCGKGDIDTVKIYIEQHPDIDIEHKNEHGATAALHAAHKLKWNLTFYLLEEHYANKMARDNYERTIFSTEIYTPMNQFKTLLKIYSLDELNTLCKTIGFKRDTFNPDQLYMSKMVKRISAFLESKDDINKQQDQNGQTALHEACSYRMIPLIIKLIERGANLDIRNKFRESAVDKLYGKLLVSSSMRFVMREALNSGPCVPAALICHFLEALKEENNDVANYIKQLYCKATLFESPKARIWNPVCTDVCKMLKVDVTDERRCLATVMLLPQHKLTEMNVRLALEGK